MSQDYSPSLVTKNLVFCGDAAMKSAAGPATLLYDKVNDNNGTMYNGSCLNFDGTDEYVLTSGYFGALAGDDDVTLCAWINVDTSGDMGIVSIGNVYMSIIVNGGYLEARCYNAGSVLTNTDAHAISTGTWYHVAGVFSGGNVTLYKDGVATAAVACSNQNIVESSNYFQLGKGYTSGYLWMDGEIANPMAFNAALSANNIKELYEDSKVIIPTKNDASGGFVAQTNLKGFWTFAEGAGDICYDGSGRGIHGTFQNMEAADWSTGQTGVPQLVEGYNRKLLFSGDDYVDCGNNSSLNFTVQNFSISCWVYIHDLTDVGYIVRRGGWGSNGWYTYLDTSGRIQIYTNDSGQGDPHTQTISNSSVITANTWHHVVWVRNGATGVIYVDGTDETSSGDSMIDPASSPANCYIGSTTNYISGIVDEVIVYDTVVTSSQAAALHATDANGGPLPPDPMSGASSLPSTSNVVSYWRNEGSGTWTDRGNNSNDGTPAGTPTTLLFKQGINGSKNVNTGRDNQGFPLLFEDVGAIGFTSPTSPWMSSSYVDLGSDSVLDLATGTIDMWFRLANPMSGGSNSASGYLLDGGPSYFYFSSSSSQLYYFLSGGSVSVSSLSGTWDTNWHNVIVKSDGVTAYMYIDGVQQTTADASGDDLFAFDASVKIGHSSASIVGQVAGLRLYNRALTYAEIQQNYNSFKNRFGK
jgi:hypothetical protein